MAQLLIVMVLCNSHMRLDIDDITSHPLWLAEGRPSDSLMFGFLVIGTTSGLNLLLSVD